MDAGSVVERMVSVSSNFERISEKPARTGYSPLFFALVGAIALLALAASIVPLNNLIVRYALCPTASAAYFQPLLGGIGPFGMDKDASGKNVMLYCNYENGNVRRYDSNAIAGAGFWGPAGIGALIGLMLYLVTSILARATKPES